MTPSASSQSQPVHRHRLFGWTLSVLALVLLFGALPSLLAQKPELTRTGLQPTPAAAVAQAEAPPIGPDGP